MIQQLLLFFSFVFAILLSSQSNAQSLDTSLVVYDNWHFEERNHQIVIEGLSKKILRKTPLLQLTYLQDLSNNSDFYKVANERTYVLRKKALKINGLRFSGTIAGFDNELDQRYLVEFRNGKLDGNFIEYKSNGKILTKIFQNGELQSDTVESKLDKIRRESN